MILNKSIKVKNYKCFNSNAQGFESIYPINIIIGKNNSGKSSLIDLVDYVINPNETFVNVGRGEIKSEIILSDIISEKYIAPVFPKGTSGGGIPGDSYYAYGMTLENSKIQYVLRPNSNKEIIYWEKPLINSSNQFATGLQNQIRTSFEGRKFKRIAAERDIKSQGVDTSSLSIGADGIGTTNVLRRTMHEVRNNNKLNNPDLIQRNLLNVLNEITKPDIEFSDIIPRDNGNGNWEIYFRDSNTGLIALSKMGSGIKTVLLVLMNMIVIPEIEDIKKEDLIFGFEELENNLHPSLQRRLFNYISNYAEENKCYFFITTHSSIVIDFFGYKENSQILHVENNGKSSIVKTVKTHFDGRNVLKDLDYKPSDLLLSNGIIWVEGPSDAIYLELLIDLYKKESKQNLERLNYTIQSLSTAIWKYAGFVDFDWNKINEDLQNQIISLEKLNHNHLLIIDNDGNYDDNLPSNWHMFQHGTGKNKAKLIFESMQYAGHSQEDLVNNFGSTKNDKLFYLINNGTFETYLKHFILNDGKDFEKYFDLDEQKGYFEKKRKGDNSSMSKVELAAEIANYCFQNELKFADFAPSNSDLEDKIHRLINTIRSWN